MITLQSERVHLKHAYDYFFVYIHLWKQSQLENVKQQSKVSGEYLTVIMINSLLDDIEDLLEKKLLNTTGKIVRLKFSNAHGIIFYKTLLNLPLDAQAYYLNMIRNHWIEILNQQIIR